MTLHFHPTFCFLLPSLVLWGTFQEMVKFSTLRMSEKPASPCPLHGIYTNNSDLALTSSDRNVSPKCCYASQPEGGVAPNTPRNELQELRTQLPCPFPGTINLDIPRLGRGWSLREPEGRPEERLSSPAPPHSLSGLPGGSPRPRGAHKSPVKCGKDPLYSPSRPLRLRASESS